MAKTREVADSELEDLAFTQRHTIGMPWAQVVVTVSNRARTPIEVGQVVESQARTPIEVGHLMRPCIRPGIPTRLPVIRFSFPKIIGTWDRTVAGLRVSQRDPSQGSSPLRARRLWMLRSSVPWASLPG